MYLVGSSAERRDDLELGTRGCLQLMAWEGFLALRQKSHTSGNFYWGPRPTHEALWGAIVRPNTYSPKVLSEAPDVTVTDLQIATSHLKLRNLAFYAPCEKFVATHLQEKTNDTTRQNSLVLATRGQAYRTRGVTELWPRQLAIAGAVAAAVFAAQEISIDESQAGTLFNRWNEFHDLTPVAAEPGQPFWLAALSPNWAEVTPRGAL